MSLRSSHPITYRRSCLFAAVALGLALFTGQIPSALASPAPLNAGVESGKLSISGMGATPNAKVTLTLNPQLSMTAVASKTGGFSFTPIPYDFVSDLVLNFTIPVTDTKKTALKNTLALKIKPTAFNVDAEGTATKAASIALNVGGAAAATGVANNSAYFRVSSPAKFSSMQSDDTKIIASIINVSEECCPRLLTPNEPVTILVQNIPTAPALNPATIGVAPTPVPPATPDAEATTLEKPARPTPGTRIKPGARPVEKGDDKSGLLERGEVIRSGSITIASSAYAASVDGTWVTGLRRTSDQVIQSITTHARMIGGFIDAQAHLDSQRSLQRLQAEALKDYTPGEALCKFGTLSRSLGASEGRALATRKAINEVLLDRETLRKNTMNSNSSGDGEFARMRQFFGTYCSKNDEGNALDRFCANTATDTVINRDIDYTRIIDAPLTLDVNFTGAPSAAEQGNNANVLALANNLYSNEAITGFNYNDFESDGIVTDDVQDMRNVIASRGVVRNSFASLVGMKAQGTGASGQYMRAVMTDMGLPAAEATRLIGDNPSYFAQMEVLTKRIYQDPRFFAELYDKPANIDRQRAAMRGINLSQQNDLLNVMQRREMLLSVLLELKLQNLDRKASGN